MALTNNQNLYGLSFCSRIYIYSKERFPVFLVLIYSLLFGLCAQVFSCGDTPFRTAQIVPLAIVVATICLFFFRLRLADEIKDYEYDVRFHPERAVVRGLLRLREVKYLIVLTLALEIIFQLKNSYFGIIAYTVFLIFSYLMFRSFFLKTFFNNNRLAELFVHQFVFVLLSVYALNTIGNRLSIYEQGDLIFLLFMLAPSFVFEMGRKLEHRKDKIGQNTDDTYVYRWGLGRSFFLIVSIGLLQGIALVLLLNRSFLGFIYIVLWILIAIWYEITPQFIAKTAKYWSIILALSSMLIFIIGKSFFTL